VRRKHVNAPCLPARLALCGSSRARQSQSTVFPSFPALDVDAVMESLILHSVWSVVTQVDDGRHEVAIKKI